MEEAAPAHHLPELQSCCSHSFASSQLCFVFFFPVLFLGLDRSKSEAGHRVGDAQNVERRHQLLFITGRSEMKLSAIQHQNEEKTPALVNNKRFSEDKIFIDPTMGKFHCYSSAKT